MTPSHKITAVKFQEMKNVGQKISMLTAYDYSMAKIFDTAGIDGILIGDSLGMVMYGKNSTLEVTMDDMIRHTQAVAEAVDHALVIADMPFMSFAIPEEALKNAGRLIQEGHADAVKLEGGREREKSIRMMLDVGIPVMGHIGLTPQYFHKLGGYRLQGTSAESAERLLEDALILQDAGVFSLVLEMVPQQIAKEISNVLDIPTIGIGAGSMCDGQILVGQDMLGFSNRKPYKFVKKYANLWNVITSAVQSYIKEINVMEFPTIENSFDISPEEYALFKEKLRENHKIDDLLHKRVKTDDKIDFISKIYGD